MNSSCKPSKGQEVPVCRTKINHRWRLFSTKGVANNDYECSNVTNFKITTISSKTNLLSTTKIVEAIHNMPSTSYHHSLAILKQLEC